MPGPEALAISQLSLMDDFTAAMILPAGAVIEAVRATFHLTWNTLVPAGFRLNCKLGKTELLLEFHGRGTQAVRQDLLVKRGRFLDVDVGGNQTVALHICEAYKHMGSMTQEKRTLHPEVVHRIGRMGLC